MYKKGDDHIKHSMCPELREATDQLSQYKSSKIYVVTLGNNPNV